MFKKNSVFQFNVLWPVCKCPFSFIFNKIKAFNCIPCEVLFVLVNELSRSKSAAQLASNASLSKQQYRLNNEKRLIDDLLANYQVKFGRPVNNRSEKVVVYFGIFLIQLIDLVLYLSLPLSLFMPYCFLIFSNSNKRMNEIKS